MSRSRSIMEWGAKTSRRQQGFLWHIVNIVRPIAWLDVHRCFLPKVICVRFRELTPIVKRLETRDCSLDVATLKLKDVHLRGYCSAGPRTRTRAIPHALTVAFEFTIHGLVLLARPSAATPASVLVEQKPQVAVTIA